MVDRGYSGVHTIVHLEGGPMKSSLFRTLCRLLIASMLLMGFSYSHATMIGADQLAASPGAPGDRSAVLQVLGRAEVAQQLQSLGIAQQDAVERVNAMTDEEVHSLRGEIDSLPAGANHSSGWWIAAVVIVALVVWYFWK
jgi:hypothetical protein